LSSGWWETAKGGGANVGVVVGCGLGKDGDVVGVVKVSTGGGASVGDELGGKGVSMRADSRSRMTSSLTIISRVLVVISKVWVVMEDRFKVRWYTASSRRSRVAWWL